MVIYCIDLAGSDVLAELLKLEDQMNATQTTSPQVQSCAIYDKLQPSFTVSMLAVGCRKAFSPPLYEWA